MMIVLFGVTACKKTTTVSNTAETIDVTLASNAAYTYQFNNPSENISITAPTSHARVSSVTNVPYTAATYQYNPDSNYVGSDSVVIVIDNTPHSHCQGKDGHCKKHKGDCEKNENAPDAAKKTFKFRFNIGSSIKE